MISARAAGMVLIVVGFGAAVAAGLWLASQVSGQSLNVGSAMLRAGLAFIPVALLVGGGIYLYTRRAEPAVMEKSSMEQQRHLVDILKARGQMPISELARVMDTSPDTVKGLLQQMIELQVFSGYIHWKEEMIYSADAGRLRGLNQCSVCGAPIRLAASGATACQTCGSEYFIT